MRLVTTEADVRIDENGDTWIRIETPFGCYEANKTKIDALHVVSISIKI